VGKRVRRTSFYHYKNIVFNPSSDNQIEGNLTNFIIYFGCDFCPLFIRFFLLWGKNVLF